MSFSPSGVTASTPTSAPLILRPAHRIEELRILGGLHRDLREEHGVGRQLRQPLHQREPLGANRLQPLQLAGILRRAAMRRSSSVTG